MRNFLVSFFIFSILLFVVEVHGQCPVTPTVPTVTCTSGNPIPAGGITIGSGQTYHINADYLSNIQIENGGTLVICGGTASDSITITSILYNGGDLVITPGTYVRFTGSYSTGGGQVRFYNLGNVTFDLTGQLNLQGNRQVYNAPGATYISVPDITLNDGNLLNYGKMIIPNFTLQGSGNLCLGPASSLEVAGNTTILANHNPALYVDEGGLLCVGITGSLTVQNNPLTNSSDLVICANSGATINPNNLGSAQVITDCAGCFIVLPLKLISFTGHLLDNIATLQWETALEEGLQSFIIERSYDGIQYEATGEVRPHNQPSKYNFTTQIDRDGYFRLKTVERDGEFYYSRVVTLKYHTTDRQIKLLANPVTKSYAEVSITLNRNQAGEILIIDNVGAIIRRVPVMLRKGNNALNIDISTIGKGSYYLHYRSNDGLKAVAFMKL